MIDRSEGGKALSRSASSRIAGGWMAARATAVRLLAISLMLGGCLLVSQAETPRAGAQLSSRAMVVQQFVDADNRVDPSAAAALYAANAVYVGARPSGNCSQQVPCTTQEGIRQQIDSGTAGHICQTILDIQVAGAVVSGRVESRSDAIRANGVEHVLLSFVAVVPQDKITFMAMLYDAADPQTARNIAINAGREAPGAAIANPSTCMGSSS